MTNNSNEVDIIDLAKKAKAKGIDTPERVSQRILAIIARNHNYIERRKAQGIRNGYNDLVSEDNEALAMAVVLFDSLAGLQGD